MSRICQHPACENPIPRSRRKFCSRRCGQHNWDLRHRSRESRTTLYDMLAYALDKLEDVEQQLAATPRQLPLFPPSKSADAARAADDATQPTRPLSDDELNNIDLEITTAKATADNNSTYNFMIASAAQVYGNFDSLPPEIIDYGIRTGRIPSEANPRRSAAVGAADNPKAMDVPQFESPNIDEDFDDLLEFAS